MKQGMSVAALSSILLTSGVVAAEGSFHTNWLFRVDYASGQYSQSTDETVSGPILMPAGTTWTCDRVAASITKTGVLNAGFACRNSSGYVNVMAYCNGTAAGEDRASAQLGSLGAGYLIISAGCATVAPKPVSKTDKSL